jgi:transposase
VSVHEFTRHNDTRRNLPEHLPRRRIVHPAPTSCPCCGSSKLSKIGEDITEALDVVPRQWFVTEHVREKFSCRFCEKISQRPAPFKTRIDIERVIELLCKSAWSCAIPK